MPDADRMIDEAINAEERELLKSIGEEPGFLEQTLGMFDQRVLWVVGLMMVVQTALFIAGVWTAWMFFEATDAVTQLRWGLPSAVLLLMSLMIKLSVSPAIWAKRLMRELKLIELHIARGAKH